MRHRLAAALLAALCATLAAQVISPGAAERASVSASKAIRMPSDAQCVQGSTVRLIFSPPAGATLASLSVRVGASEALQLAGLAGAGSLVVKVPRPGVRVSATGTTSTGAFISVRRSYERCVAHPTPSPGPPPQTPAAGGGGGG